MRALFLDRDGVINEDRTDYIRSLDEFVYFPWTERAFRVLARVGLPIVVVSNQSGIGRGFVEESVVGAMHARLADDASRWGAPIAAVEYCPHVPDDRCRCRKPEPEMFERAARRHAIDLRGSYMVGDKATDVEAGKRLGMTTIHVETGLGRALPPGSPMPDHVAADLLKAAERIEQLERAAGHRAP